MSNKAIAALITSVRVAFSDYAHVLIWTFLRVKKRTLVNMASLFEVASIFALEQVHFCTIGLNNRLQTITFPIVF